MSFINRPSVAAPNANPIHCFPEMGPQSLHALKRIIKLSKCRASVGYRAYVVFQIWEEFFEASHRTFVHTTRGSLMWSRVKQLRYEVSPHLPTALRNPRCHGANGQGQEPRIMLWSLWGRNAEVQSSQAGSTLGGAENRGPANYETNDGSG
jgi:hypothetical protein